MLEIIVKGKLDYADGSYLITEEGTALTCRLGYFLARHTGKTIVISLEEEEPILNANVKELLVEA